jgi:biotin carboxyl carrier protein
VTVDIDLAGTRRRIALRRGRDGWIAGIDGREVEVSVVEAGGGWSMLVGTSSYDVSFDPAPGGELIVSVNGIAVPLTVIDPGPPKPRAKAAHRGRRGARDGEAGRDKAGKVPLTIVAPMPGRIVRVLVKPEETVSPGQPLVVVEAMKMENELRASRAGIVAEVRVAEGASVEANTVLVVLR